VCAANPQQIRGFARLPEAPATTIVWAMVCSRLAVSSAAVIAAAALGGGCGASVSVNDKGQVAVGEKTLDVASLPFTLRYPGSFQEATGASAAATHSVAVVGIPGEDSYIAVHKNGSAPMTASALEAQARKALGTNISSSGRARHGGIEMFALTTPVAGTGDLSATMNAFSTSHATWLIECRSNPANRQRMAQWCAAALDSLKLR
jgi:hypothetical protein